MRDKTNYIFEKDFWGNWKLVPKKSDSGITGLILFVIVALIFCVAIVTLPFWIALLGFGMVKTKRHYAGIGSLLAILYFIIDVKNKWITGFLFLGYNDSTGHFVEGLIGEKAIVYVYLVNSIGIIMGVAFIIQSYLLNKGTNETVNTNEANQSILQSDSNSLSISEQKKLSASNRTFIIFGLLALIFFAIIYYSVHNKEDINTKRSYSLPDTQNEAIPSKGSYPQASNRLLTYSDIKGHSKQDLKIMRNEIFARHGYIFTTPDMEAYFSQQSWYSGRYKDVTSKLSSIELQNVAFINSAENKLQSPNQVSENVDEIKKTYIESFIQVENDKDFNKLSNYFAPTIRRYWDKYNPTLSQIKRVIFHIWGVTSFWRQTLRNVTIENDSTVKVEISIAYITKKTSESKIKDYYTYFVFDANNQIVEIYGYENFDQLSADSTSKVLNFNTILNNLYPDIKIFNKREEITQKINVTSTFGLNETRTKIVKNLYSTSSQREKAIGFLSTFYNIFLKKDVAFRLDRSLLTKYTDFNV